MTVYISGISTDRLANDNRSPCLAMEELKMCVDRGSVGAGRTWHAALISAMFANIYNELVLVVWHLVTGRGHHYEALATMQP